jgi:ribosomal protein S18 acetylase RimI-like enzyme
MPEPSLRIAPLMRRDAGAAADVLARSHADYPSFAAVFPDRRRRARALRPFFAATTRDALRHGHGHGAWQDGRLVGAALWLPPGAFPWSAARKARSMPAMLRVLAVAPRSFRRFAALGANVERAHPPGAHWYLEALGVQPGGQGAGVGSALARAGLARADAQGTPCYVETADGANVRFYQRLGFELVDDALPLVPNGPTYWALFRPVPRGSELSRPRPA